ncbi:MAG: alpha-amylase family protein [Actinomycetales bacterium]
MRTRKVAGSLLAAGLVVGGLGVSTATAPDAHASYDGPRAGMVQMFEWPWDDLARECTNHLGPKGYWAVQVSPPNEHARVAGDPWWERYQPVTYELDSRSGDRAEFEAMVRTCNDAGVEIIADVVLNHMAAVTGTSITGRPFQRFQYPSYGQQDFHQFGCDVTNYNDRFNVQNCELLDLPDLDTDASYVRQQQLDYLNDLVAVGVGGFRVDAAKHIPSSDLAWLFDRVNGDPYVFTEVIDFGGEAVGAGEYTGIGDVTEFRYGQRISDTFFSGTLASLVAPNPSWDDGLLSSSNAVSFVANHDTARGEVGGRVLTYKDGALFNLAQVFTLAYPYGNPVFTSEYNWSDSDEGPPSNSSGITIGAYESGDSTVPSGCDGIDPWVCEHRWGNVANMVGFRAATTGAWSVNNVWTNGFQQIAFSRGSLGFVAINRETSGMDRTLQTGMPAGTYCDVLSGDFDLATRACSGRTVSVASDGTVRVTLNGLQAFAIHAGSRL